MRACTGTTRGLPLSAGTVERTAMRGRPFRADLVDLGLPCALAAAAALATKLLEGSSIRLLLALTVLFFVPGHLLIAAATRVPDTSGQRPLRALVALGVSPALVGVLALATALLPWGFRPDAIVAVVTLACFALAGIAAFRRRASRDLLAGPRPIVHDLDEEAEGTAA